MSRVDEEGKERMMRGNGDVSNQAIDVQAELASLTRRLEDGEARIKQAITHGDDVAAWEDFWLRLLHEYESLHDSIAAERDSAQGDQRIAA